MNILCDWAGSLGEGSGAVMRLVVQIFAVQLAERSWSIHVCAGERTLVLLGAVKRRLVWKTGVTRDQKAVL